MSSPFFVDLQAGSAINEKKILGGLKEGSVMAVRRGIKDGCLYSLERTRWISIYTKALPKNHTFNHLPSKPFRNEIYFEIYMKLYSE